MDPEVIYAIAAAVAAIAGFAWQNRRDRQDINLLLEIHQRVAVLEAVVAGWSDDDEP